MRLKHLESRTRNEDDSTDIKNIGDEEMYDNKPCCCCLLIPLRLLVGVVRCSCLWSTSQFLRPSGQQCSHSGGVCPQIQGLLCGAYVGAIEEIMCVVCVSVTEGHSSDGCDLASTLCKYDLRECDLFVLSFMSVVVIVWGSVGMFVV